MKRTVSLIMAAVLLTALVVPVMAATPAENKETDNEKLSYILSSTSSIEISGISAECKAFMQSKQSLSLTITMELQKESGGTYSTVKTWTATGTGLTLSSSESRLINVLSTYRLKTTFTAGSESVVQYRYA